MDDLILIGDHLQKISTLKSLLAKEFEIKDLKGLKYFLGMKIAQSNTRIVVSQ